MNFIPSYAANTYEIWHNYNHNLVDSQLRMAADAGFNAVRLWLNYAAYEQASTQMIANLKDALQLVASHHLKAVVVVFDSCGVRPRKDTRWMVAPEAYDEFQKSSRFNAEQKAFMATLFKNYVRGFGSETMVPVASDSPLMALVYQKWVPTPGNDRLGPEWYSKLERYVDAVIDASKDSPSILFWDLMNEPEWASEGPLSPTEMITPEMKKTRDAFLDHFYHYIKRRHPTQLVSIGWARLEDAEEYSRLADVVTFHIYGEPANIQSAIDKAQAFSKVAGKQMLITETLANWDFGSSTFGTLASDEQQLAHYQKVLPVLLRSPIGWISWGLVVSQDFDPFTDIFYPDGHPRPAALFLEQQLKNLSSDHKN